MLESIIDWDYQLFGLMNGKGPVILDQIMIFFSDKLIWIPLYLWIIFKLTEQYEHRILWVLVPVILAVALSDQVTSGLMKPFFERLRPCRDPSIADSIIIVSKCGGKYGFASSHAANTMALAFLAWCYLRNRFAAILLVWAFIVGYSRIYLGVHFPGDVIVGFLVGISIALMLYLSQKALFPSVFRSGQKT